MMNACDVEYAYSYVEDVDNLGLFNWPAPRFQKHPFCHRVKNAVLCDATDYSLRLPFIFGSNLLLIGDLWSSDRSCTALPVKAIVDSHLVEITQSVSKVTVALWVKDHVDVWYKLIIPRSLVYNDLDKEFAQLIHGFAADPSIEGLVECALLVDADGAEANIMDLLKATNGSGESVRFLQGIGILPGAKANVRINVTAAELVVREGVGNIVERTVRVSSGFGHWYRLLSPECAPAAVRTIYEHVYLAKTSLGDLFTVTDFRVVVSGQPVAPTTLGSSKGLLTGKLLGAGTAAAINICFAVDDYFVDMNNMSLDSPNFFVRTVDGCWCKLLRSADHPIDFPALLARYDWPADSKDEAWRHMTDFKVSSANSMCSMLDVVEDAAASLKPFMITCSLISPHNNTAKLKVRLYPNRYSVDFGLTEGDPNAGLWVCVDEGLQWYKVVPPALPEYATLAAMDLRRTSQVILLHDALVRVSDAICISLGKNGKKYCNFSLDEVWDMVHCLQAKKGKGTFSLDAIREDGQFAMNNLDLVIDFSKSKHLTKSLLTGALVKKMNIAAVQLPLVVPANSSAVAVSDLKDTFTSKAVPIGKKRKTTISYDDGEEKDEDNLPIAKLPKSLHSCPSAPPILTHIAPIANRSIGKRARIDDDCDMPPVLRRDQIHHAPQFTVLPMSAAVCGPKAETYSFCRYCQSLNKKHNCKSRDHVDGFPFRGHLLASTSVRLARPEQDIGGRGGTLSRDIAVLHPLVASTPRGEECTFCKSLSKAGRCMNQRHIDGQYLIASNRMVDVSLSHYGLCPNCRSTKKLDNCMLAEHVNGFQMSSSISSLPLLGSSSHAAVTAEREEDEPTRFQQAVHRDTLVDRQHYLKKLNSPAGTKRNSLPSPLFPSALGSASSKAHVASISSHAMLSTSSDANVNSVINIVTAAEGYSDLPPTADNPVDKGTNQSCCAVSRKRRVCWADSIEGRSLPLTMMFRYSCGEDDIDYGCK